MDPEGPPQTQRLEAASSQSRPRQHIQRPQTRFGLGRTGSPLGSDAALAAGSGADPAPTAAGEVPAPSAVAPDGGQVEADAESETARSAGGAVAGNSTVPATQEEPAGLLATALLVSAGRPDQPLSMVVSASEPLALDEPAPAVSDTGNQLPQSPVDLEPAAGAAEVLVEDWSAEERIEPAELDADMLDVLTASALTLPLGR